MALIDSSQQIADNSLQSAEKVQNSEVVSPNKVEVSQPKTENRKLTTNPNAFISPLIISIAQKENLSIEELQTISGSGIEGRLQKSDVFNYLKNRKYPLKSIPIPTTQNLQPTTFPKPKINFVEGKDRIVEMDRMRKISADHMV